MKEELESISNEGGIPGGNAPEITNLDKNARWYVLHTFSNYEVVAKDNLEKVIKKEHLENRIFDIFIPEEEIMVEKRGAKVLSKNKTMPSYLFVKMIYGDDLWHTVTRTNGITGFVGPKGRPLPLSEKEVHDMKIERKINNIITRVEAGDTVHIIDGQFAGQTAVVTALDTLNNSCKIEVTMFGRPTTVSVPLISVKKI
jgi:transcriptional antiterminator NusG